MLEGPYEIDMVKSGLEGIMAKATEETLKTA